MFKFTLWPLPSAVGVQRSGHSETLAKVQKNIFRCKRGDNWEVVGSWSALTDIIFTN